VTGHALARAAWFAGALLSLVWFMPLEAWPAPLAFVALATSLSLVPGACLARAIVRPGLGVPRTALALLAGPAVVGAGMAIARAAGVGAAAAAHGVALVSAALATWEALRPRDRNLRPLALEPGTALGLLAGLALALAYLTHPELLARSDGAFHAGLEWAAERAWPPTDPFFAGMPLHYFWGLHAWGAGWLALAPGLGAYAPLAWSSVTAVVATSIGVAALAGRLGAGPRGRLLAQALAVAGAAPFAWLVLAGRMASGERRGLAELSWSLGRGADRALRSLDPGWLHPSLALPLDKFVVVTPFAWALAAAPLSVLALVAGAEGRGVRAAVPLALVTATALFLHPVAGLALAAAAFAGALAFAFRGGPARVGALRSAGALLLGLAAAAPYLTALAPASHGAISIGLAAGVAGVMSALLAGAFVLPAALAALVDGRRSDGASAALLASLAALVLPACLLRLGGDNQSKFLNLAFVLAAAPAAVAYARLSPPRRAVAAFLLVASALPTLAAMGFAYAHQSASSEDAPSRPPDDIVRAVADHVPRDAVLVDATLDTTRGAAPALPGETGRELLWGGGFLAIKRGAGDPALVRRAEAARALALGAPGETSAMAWLDSLGREVWLVLPETPTRAADPRERVVARAGNVQLVRVGR